METRRGVKEGQSAGVGVRLREPVRVKRKGGGIGYGARGLALRFLEQGE